MTALRHEIDGLDGEIVALLARRAALIDRAAELKLQAGMPARIDSRVEAVLANVQRQSGAVGLDPDLAEDIWRRLIEWSIRNEEATLGTART